MRRIITILFLSIFFSFVNACLGEDTDIPLSSEEVAWLSTNHTVRVRIGHAPPFMFTDGNIRGIAIDYLTHIFNLHGIHFTYVMGSEVTWPQALKYIEQHDVVDMVPTAKVTDERKQHMLFTNEYITAPWVIFTRSDANFIASIEDLKGKLVSVEEGFVIHNILKRDYPQIRLKVASAKNENYFTIPIKELSTGLVDAYIGNLLSTTYMIQTFGYTNVKVAAPTPFENHNQAMAIRNDWPELASIINKTLTSMTPDEHTAIRNRWLGVRYEYGISYTDVVKWILSLLAGASLVVGFVLLSNRRLKKEVALREKIEADILESENRLRSALDATPFPVAFADLNADKILYWSRSALSLFGHTVPTTSEWFKVAYPDPDYRQEVIERWEPFLEIAKTSELPINTGEYQITCKDGSVKTCELYATFVIDYLIVTFSDITERKNSEEKMTKNQQIMAQAEELADLGSWEWDIKNDTWLLSDNWKRIHGVSDKNLTSDQLLQIAHPEDSTAINESFARTLEKGEPYEIQHRIIRQDTGEIRDIYAKGIVVFDNARKPATLVGAAQDITQRKRAEGQLQKSEEQFRNLYNEAPVGYFEYDLQGNITRVNHTYLKMLGYVAEEVIGQPCWKFIFDEVAREQIMAKVRGVRPPAKGLERIYQRKDGTTFPVLFEDRLLLDEEGNIKGIRTAIQDIAEHKQANKEKEKLQEQLNQAQKMESVGRLAGGVAHDFNNMLGVILGHTEIALEETDPASLLYADLHSIHQAAERSAALTRQLLAFARKQTVVPKIIDLNETVEEMLKMLRQLIGEDIDLLWQPSRNLQPVKVDPAQIDQLLVNLCVNARDAIVGAGKVTIETDTKIFDEAYCNDHLGSLPGEYVLLVVSDDGCGMDKKTLSQIFEPFFTTKEQGKGTGLGLASIYGIVKQNNGFISVYSELDQGTTFKIYLPVYVAKSDESAEKAPDLPAEHGNETILLVEDETAILEMTTRMLERLSYTVVAAATPVEAIRLAQEYQGQIDLLMTDVVMPEMNGRELAANLLSQYPDLKRLFMSGYTANVIAHHGVLDEGVHFIQKPFSKKDLGRKVRQAMQG